MTREDIEKDGTVSPLGKLIVEWLARHEQRLYKASEVGVGLGMYGSQVSEEAHNLRRKGLVERLMDGKVLELGELVLSRRAREAYSPEQPAKKVKA